MSIFFTSDTHFSSERTLKLSLRPFDTVEQMDSALIKNWNKKVKDEDVIYHLGDFGSFDKVKSLNGKIILILGNYEKKEMKENFNNDFASYKKHLLNLGFSDVIENNLEILRGGRKYNLTHEPLDCKKNMFNLFGHIHGRQLVKKFGLDVGVDGHHFMPVDEKTIEFFYEAITKHYDNNVFCTENEIASKNEFMK